MVTEEFEHEGRTAAEEQPAGHATGHATGHEGVDEVLGSLEGLEELPVEEHVAVFEAAHDRLRAALAEASDRPSGPSTG